MIYKYNKNFLTTYDRFDIVFVRGEGKYLYDFSGKKYLDFFCGISVCNLGHCNKKIIREVKKQVEKLWHVSNYFNHEKQSELANLLVKKTFQGKVFFSNSGAESIECAIKLARKYGSINDRYEIITFKNSFHGRTLATVSATGQEKFHKDIGPLVTGFKYAELNDIDSVKKLYTKKTVAIMIEPIQGEGGINPATKDFLVWLRKFCNSKGLILIFDEVQTGFGRTGELFAFQHFNVVPDILCLAKSIANGLPLAATVVSEKYASVFNFGDHGTTFGGNILSCTAAVEVLKLIDKKLLKNVKRTSKYFFQKLYLLKEKYEFIKEVRGVGLMIGVELDIDAKEVVKKSLKKGLVINAVQQKVLRFLPPLIITERDVDFCTNILDEIFREV